MKGYIYLTNICNLFMKKPFLKLSVVLSFLTFGKVKAQQTTEITGLASYYHSKFDGRPTAQGEPYDETALTAAHRTLPFNTLVQVTNLITKKTITVRINDRGPFAGKRVIDLSRSAAQILGIVPLGVAQVSLKIIEWGAERPRKWAAATTEAVREATPDWNELFRFCEKPALFDPRQLSLRFEKINFVQ